MRLDDHAKQISASLVMKLLIDFMTGRVGEPTKSNELAQHNSLGGGLVEGDSVHICMSVLPHHLGMSIKQRQNLTTIIQYRFGAHSELPGNERRWEMQQ
jgi:hypothetical protein